MEQPSGPVAGADGIPAGDWKAPERRLFGNIIRDLAKATNLVEVRDVEDSYRASVEVKGEAFKTAAMGLIRTKGDAFKAGARSRL